ncbi:MAG: hypothetical protein M1351_10260 [Candidatus Thermoplasmatota archaeon]|jgi:hypothetical protein|nr:hypothetical protein [Candidatus Thermoplasmatota archaeon]
MIKVPRDGMSPLFDLFIVLWVIVSLSLSIWTYNDAFLLSYSRAWAIAVFFFPPSFFPLYLFWSRWRKIPAGNFKKPDYEVNTAVFSPQAVNSTPAEPAARSESASKAAVSAAEDDSAYLSSELPRCPGCNTAVSFYDVQCLKCGQPLKRVASKTAF